MDQESVSNIVEAAQTSFEAKISERLRKTEDDLHSLEAKFQFLQKIAGVIATRLIPLAQVKLYVVGLKLAGLRTAPTLGEFRIPAQSPLSSARFDQYRQFRQSCANLS
jgi:hypothetical protein